MQLRQPLPRQETGTGLLDEYAAFATLLESLEPHDWRAPTRCEGFEVRDVAGHVVGLTEDVAAGVPGSRTAEQEAASLRDLTPAEVAGRLRAAAASIRALFDVLDDAAWNAPSPVPDLTLGEGVLTLWYDAYVHGDDIRAAIGRPSETGPGLGASVQYLAAMLTDRDWGPATLVLEGQPRLDVGAGGPEVRGDALEFVLAATGRLDPSKLGLDETVNIYAES